MLLVLFVLLSFIRCSTQTVTCTAIDQCSCRLTNGSQVSLHQLDKHNGIAFQSLIQGAGTSFFIDYNPCTTFVHEKYCHNVLACQYAKGSQDQVFPIANPDRHTFLVGASGNVIMQYSAVSPSDQQTRTFNIELVCDLNAVHPQTSAIQEFPSRTYTLKLTHRCACAGVCNSHDAPSDSSSSLSTGSLLCILLLVFVIVYVIGGILFLKFYKKEEGSDTIPHREFWIDFPSKVKDGCTFTWEKIRKKDSEYETI